MLESIPIILLSVALSGFTTYFVGKKLMNDTKKGIIKQIPEILPQITDFFIDDLTDFLHTEDGAKLVYSIGALIGNGARQGLGINAKGGKFKFEDILAQVAAGFIQQYFPTSNPQRSQNRKPDTRTGLNI